MTDLATIARQNAVECIKVGYRQGKEGHILSLAMNPHDVPDAVATASLGSRWMVALVQISDDEQPQGQDNSGSAPSPSLADAADSPAAAPTPGSSSGRTAEFGSANGGSNPSPGTKPTKRWEDYSPSQQAGMACGWPNFQDWIRRQAPANRHDGQYARLQSWWRSTAFCDSAEVVDYVRWYCGVSSRAELDTNPEAAKRWRELHSMFTADTQYGDRR